MKSLHRIFTKYKYMGYTYNAKKLKDNLMNEPYKVLLMGNEAETELKKSRFIAHLCAVETEEEAMQFITSIKKQYYDARHNCYAYIIGKDADRVKYSDDGEPSQTAGLPIFNILKESGVRNCCIVVTRYFGGTLLGAGPLARMYAEAAKLGLEASKIGTMRFGVEIKIDTDYSDGEKVRRHLEREGIEILETFYSQNVTMLVRTGFETYDKLVKDVTSITASKANIERVADAYFVDTKM